MQEHKEQEIRTDELQEETDRKDVTQTADDIEETKDEAVEGEVVDTEDEEEPEADETETEPKKKGFFSKKKDKKEEQIEDLTDRLKRQMAEFDNFRKRTEKEKSMMYEIGAKSVVEKLLPVVDNFERGLAAAEDAQDDPFVEGMDKIYKQLMAMLEELEVKPIEALGQEFNPDYHNAVMHVEDDEAGDNEIIEEFQKGYMYRESVVRHSMVKVAN